jgi:hypothetical protein
MPRFSHAIAWLLNFELIRQNNSLNFPSTKLSGKREAGEVYAQQATSKDLNI